MTDEQRFEANTQNDMPLIPPPPPSGFVNTGAVVTDTGTSIERVAIISALVALVGSFLPWARVFIVTINGTDGDGIITAILSSIALFLIYSSRRALAQKKTGQVQLGFAVLSMAIAAIVYIYDFANLTSLSEEDSNEIIQITVEPQIGIIIGSIGAVVGTIACSMIWNKRRNPKIAVVHYPTN